MTAVVTPLVLRDAICEALWEHVRAQDLAEVYVYLGLEPEALLGLDADGDCQILCEP